MIKNLISYKFPIVSTEIKINSISYKYITYSINFQVDILISLNLETVHLRATVNEAGIQSNLYSSPNFAEKYCI